MPDHLQFTQDVTRHRLPIEAHRFSGRNTYDLTSFAISMVVGKLPEYRISLAGCGRLFSRVDLDGLSQNTAKLHLDEIYDLIVLVPQHEDLD